MIVTQWELAERFSTDPEVRVVAFEAPGRMVVMCRGAEGEYEERYRYLDADERFIRNLPDDELWQRVEDEA